jgi:hypothetical protein
VPALLCAEAILSTERWHLAKTEREEFEAAPISGMVQGVEIGATHARQQISTI